MAEPAKYTRCCKLSIKKAPVIFKKNLALHCPDIWWLHY